MFSVIEINVYMYVHICFSCILHFLDITYYVFTSFLKFGFDGVVRVKVWVLLQYYGTYIARRKF